MMGLTVGAVVIFSHLTGILEILKGQGCFQKIRIELEDLMTIIEQILFQQDNVNSRYAHCNVQNAENAILDSIVEEDFTGFKRECSCRNKGYWVKIEERIIVINEVLSAKQEVRIIIQDNILTEIFISEGGKQINVNFVTGASGSTDILNQRGGGLQSQLMENLKDVDFVEVNIEDQSSQYFNYKIYLLN